MRRASPGFQSPPPLIQPLIASPVLRWRPKLHTSLEFVFSRVQRWKKYIIGKEKEGCNPPGGGGYSGYLWEGVCRWEFDTLTL